MKFAMYGSGAAGSVFASYLRKGGADIILIDRYEAHMKKVAEEGMHFTIHQEEDGGYKDYDYQLKGFRTYITAADAAAAEGKVDVIIYMTTATTCGTARSTAPSASTSAPACWARLCPSPRTACPPRLAACR